MAIKKTHEKSWSLCFLYISSHKGIKFMYYFILLAWKAFPKLPTLSINADSLQKFCSPDLGPYEWNIHEVFVRGLVLGGGPLLELPQSSIVLGQETVNEVTFGFTYSFYNGILKEITRSVIQSLKTLIKKIYYWHFYLQFKFTVSYITLFG